MTFYIQEKYEVKSMCLQCGDTKTTIDHRALRIGQIITDDWCNNEQKDCWHKIISLKVIGCRNIEHDCNKSGMGDCDNLYFIQEEGYDIYKMKKEKEGE